MIKWIQTSRSSIKNSLSAHPPSRILHQWPEPPSVDPCCCGYSLRILVWLVIYDSGKVSLEHLLLSRQPSQPHLFFLSGTSPEPARPAFVNFEKIKYFASIRAGLPFFVCKMFGHHAGGGAPRKAKGERLAPGEARALPPSRGALELEASWSSASARIRRVLFRPCGAWG